MRQSRSVQLRLVIGNRNYSSWSLRAWLLLAEAGIAFEEIRIPLDTPEFADSIRRWSPAARVPVLMLDDHPVWDTLAIAETLADLYPDAKLWPDDDLARAHARSVAAEMHSGFSELRDTMPMNCRAHGRKVRVSVGLQAEVDRIAEIFADCHKRYGARGDWLFGDRFTVADAMYAPVILRFRTYGVDLPEAAGHYPRRLLESAALQNWLRAAESEIEVVEQDEKGRQ